jgi:hypothetical protein
MDVCRVQALVAGFNLEFDLLPFLQRLETYHRNRGKVDEHI